MSGARDLEFEAISDLIDEINFQINNLTFLNIKIKEEKDFFEEPENFEK